MKIKLKNLNATLTYSLESMYDAEKRIQSELPTLVNMIASNALAKATTAYVETSADKRTKLKRVFSYLLAGPFENISCSAEGFFLDLERVAKISSPSAVRDLLAAKSLRGLALHKSFVYEGAMELAGQLGLEKVSELLEEILAWEKNYIDTLKKIELSLITSLQKETVKPKAS